MELKLQKVEGEENLDIIEKIVPILSSGGMGVLPTDTLYGLVGSALKKETIDRIYALRKRNPQKPMIVLISSFKDLDDFEIALNEKRKKRLSALWPGKISIVLKCDSEKFRYLHRESGTLAFRMPNDDFLNRVLEKTGPLVAPSANVEGCAPAENLEEAREYFRDAIDFYVDAGNLESKPSTLASIDEEGKLNVLRQGAVKIDC
ncbi:MAG TPA: L-threonylcarbamoyladenylate synthase [Candidatus Moranbacteria bacterium]|jgi:L-threonylcarbamoyladenylate synthase|nr:L-threonylcarbamoyladenylate synthase [Candidatus Moranbacteria bacterium]HQB59398.1 L-threonylcarbamoyladenylate synthase [Candidatus Moranbacteria bacterium]